MTEATVLLDLSRLLSRAGRLVPTGIDRVELAYAEQLIARIPHRLVFAAMHPWGRFGGLPRDPSLRFIANLSSLWCGAETDPALSREIAAGARRLRRALLLHGPATLDHELKRRNGRIVYLLVSHHHLDRPAAIRRLKQRTDARFVCFVHDVIPIDYPEYARPGIPERHVRRMTTAAELADGIVVNSQATAVSFRRFLSLAGRAPAVLVAPLGADPPSAGPYHHQVAEGRPTFVCIGTIEPRKNHLLLLNIWRRMAEESGCSAPRLMLIGQRGWENENVIDMIERCTALRGIVEEHNDLPDGAVRRLLSNARALLMPSFAEGYGLPLAEALSLGVPALCSDLPALREVGQSAPEYFDPLDAPSWLAAIRDYSHSDSGRRAAQLARLDGWQAPRWSDHLSAALAFVNDVARLEHVAGETAKAAGGAVEWRSEAARLPSPRLSFARGRA